ncbi:MAG: glutamate-5-semialdehyde dehydrogenase [Pseudomonadota bacterium]
MDDMLLMAKHARAAMKSLDAMGGDERSALIHAVAAAIRSCSAVIERANGKDVENGETAGLSAAMLDRLLLDGPRIEAMATALDTIAGLSDPLQKTLAEWERPNGLLISRVTVPLGVIGIIYESRPNVTADAAAICLKAGNCVILRGGSESARSSRAIVNVIRETLKQHDIDPNAVQIVPDQDRARVGALLTGLDGQVDVVVPRGGRSLVERVQREARVPVIGHLEGLCHVYIDASAAVHKAEQIVLNAKLRRTGICGAAETLLIDRAFGEEPAVNLLMALSGSGCEIRGCEQICEWFVDTTPATEDDWVTEYLAPIISVRVVDGVEEAIQHISHYGSGHTDAIVAEDDAVASRFLRTVDSAIVMHNASTQFADGGEFGMGAEIGISTSRIHARGPVGAEQLTSYKYVVRGTGQVRSL